jgi:hypothetical protein
MSTRTRGGGGHQQDTCTRGCSRMTITTNKESKREPDDLHAEMPQRTTRTRRGTSRSTTLQRTTRKTWRSRANYTRMTMGETMSSRKHRNGITSEHHAQKVIMPPHKRTRRPTRKNDSSDPHAQEGAHLDVRVSSELHARHGDEIDLHANDGGRDEEANNTHMNRDHRRTPRTQRGSRPPHT